MIIKKPKRKYSIGLRVAILSILKAEPNVPFSKDEVRRRLIEEYGDTVSNNIGSIGSVLTILCYEGNVERLAGGSFRFKEKIKTDYPGVYESVLEIFRKNPDIILNKKTILKILSEEYGTIVPNGVDDIRSAVVFHEARGNVKILEEDSFLYSGQAVNSGFENKEMKDNARFMAKKLKINEEAAFWDAAEEIYNAKTLSDVLKILKKKFTLKPEVYGKNKQL